MQLLSSVTKTIILKNVQSVRWTRNHLNYYKLP